MRPDGILVVDKPAGITSLGVVKDVKRRFGLRRAGHIGTLDPFATGVLPIVINEGTKLVPFLHEEPKVYEAVLKLGEETATDDLTGDVVFSRSCDDVSPGAIRSVFDGFMGRIQQIPPMFSAIKMQGKPLYRLARKGIEVERKERDVEIRDLQISVISLPCVRFTVACSKGTYIRALARDIGRRIGCGAHLVALVRLQSGPFTLEQAVRNWRELSSEALFLHLISIREALCRLPELIADEDLVRKVRFGKEMLVRDLPRQGVPSFIRGEWLRMSSVRQEPVAILKSEITCEEIATAPPGRVALRPMRIFQSPMAG
jgi:tRNA pseudouridine55 synthase